MSWIEVEKAARDLYSTIEQTFVAISDRIVHKSYSMGDVVIGGLVISVISGVIIMGVVQYYSFDKNIARQLHNDSEDGSRQ